MAEINRESQEFAEIMAQVNREMRMYGELHVSTAERLKDAEMKTKYGLDGFSKASGMGADALAKFGEAAFSSGKALLEGKKGASALNSTMDQLTDSVKMAAVALTFLVPGGPLIKGLVAGIGLLTVSVLEAGKKYTQAANTMSDQLYKGYQDLAQSGAAASDGMTGLFNDAKKLGLSMNEIGQYTELIAANSKDLALFSGSVFEGRKRFADMGEAMEPFKESLMNAGLSQEQINAGSMAYLRIQTRTGAAQNKTTEELAAGAKKYLNEQDLLAKVTGQSRKEMEDQQARALQQQQFASKVRELTKAGQTEAVDRLMALNSMYSAMGPKMAAAFQASVTGNYANADAIEVGIASQNEMMRTTDMVIKNQMSVAEAAQKTGKTIGKFNDDVNIGLAGVNASIGDFSEFEKARQMADGDIVANMKKADDERKKQGMDGSKAADAAVQAQTDLVLMQQKGNKAVEQFVFAGVVPATKAMTVLVEKTTLAAGAMAKMFGVGVGPQAATAASTGPSTDEARKTVAAATEKAKADAERARAAEKDAALSKEQKEAIKKQAADSARDMMNETNALRAAAQREKNAERTARRAGTAAPAGGGAAPAAGGGATPASGAAPASGATTRSMAPAGGSPPPSAGSPDGQPGKTTPAAGGAGSLKIGPNADMSGVIPEMVSRLEQFAQASGKSVDVNSAYRSDQKQAELWVRGNILKEPGILMPAAPKDDQEITYKGKTYQVKGQGKGSLHGVGNAVDISVAGMGKSKGPIDELLANAGLFRPFIANDHPHVQMMADGGIVKASNGGTPAIIGEGGRDEAVIPLKDGAVPVSLNLKDALNTPSMGGYNEYAGYNMGPMSTDIEAVKKLAEAVGAFDKTSQIITDPATWKQILSSGLATNYKLVNAELGTKALPGIDQDMADRLKEIKEQGNTTTEAALKQVGEELIKGMSSMAEKFAVTMTGRALSMDSSEIAPLLQELVSATKNGVDVQQKILASSY
jgi:hypothetical protein